MPKLLNILGQRPTYSGTDVWHWPLDEGTGTTAAERINAVDLTLYNTPTWGTNDSINGMQDALAFNGTNEYATRTSTILDMSTVSVSVAAWVYISREGTGANTVFGNLGGTDNKGFIISTEKDASTSNHKITLTMIGSSSKAWPFTYLVPLNTWTHVVVTINRPVSSYATIPGKLYINGAYYQEVGVGGTGLDSITPTDAAVVVGRAFGGNYLQGKLSDIWLFRNKVLTASEVLELYKYLGD